MVHSYGHIYSCFLSWFLFDSWCLPGKNIKRNLCFPKGTVCCYLTASVSSWSRSSYQVCCSAFFLKTFFKFIFMCLKKDTSYLTTKNIYAYTWTCNRCYPSGAVNFAHLRKSFINLDQWKLNLMARELQTFIWLCLLNAYFACPMTPSISAYGFLEIMQVITLA